MKTQLIIWLTVLLALTGANAQDSTSQAPDNASKKGLFITAGFGGAFPFGGFSKTEPSDGEELTTYIGYSSSGLCSKLDVGYTFKKRKMIGVLGSFTYARTFMNENEIAVDNVAESRNVDFPGVHNMFIDIGVLFSVYPKKKPIVVDFNVQPGMYYGILLAQSLTTARQEIESQKISGGGMSLKAGIAARFLPREHLVVSLFADVLWGRMSASQSEYFGLEEDPDDPLDIYSIGVQPTMVIAGLGFGWRQ